MDVAEAVAPTMSNDEGEAGTKVVRRERRYNQPHVKDVAVGMLLNHKIITGFVESRVKSITDPVC